MLVGDLKSMPIRLPDLKNSEEKDRYSDFMASVIKLIEMVNASESQNNRSEIAYLEDKIDEYIYKLYGLTDNEIRLVERIFR